MPVWGYSTGWQRITPGNAQVRAGGIWRDCVAVYAKVAGVWKNVLVADNQTNTITVGNQSINAYTDLYGYDNANEYDPYYAYTSGFGSMTNGADFTDSQGNDRDIAAAYWLEFSPPEPQTPAAAFIFGINGLSVPNTNDTFLKLILNVTPNLVLNRADATYDSNVNGGGSSWSWEIDPGELPTSGSIDITIAFQ